MSSEASLKSLKSRWVTRAAIVVALVGLDIGLQANIAHAADACISDGAKKEASSCPANAGGGTFDVGKHGKAPQVNFHSAPQAADLKKRDQQMKPNMPGISDVPRDDRKSKLQNRARALLVTEISGLESLFNTTAKNSPDRVDLSRRLAEDYVELETAAFKEKTQAEVDRDAAKKTNPKLASQKQATANQAGQFMTRARGAAEKYYGIIRSDYPNYSKLDEVLYYLAYEYEQSNDNAHARQVYLELIKTRPQSKYIPNAYLAFGELFFNEAQGDTSKFELAGQAYSEVIKFPPQTNKVYGYAWYKLGYVKWNQGDFPGALNAFKKTIDWGTAYRDQPGAAKLADSARHDTIPVYALKGDPSAAY
ncbi:MAG: tetratricopeptide repeat protein, partial [Polyangiaceae bacterium]